MNTKDTGGFRGRIRKMLSAKMWIVVALGLGFAVGYRFRPTPPAGPEQTAAPAEPQKQQIWTCSMHPQIRLPHKGLCPICNMELIPLKEDGGQTASSLRELTVSEHAMRLMDIETAPVERKFVTKSLRIVGKVDYDETRLASITAWVPGRMDRLYVDYTGVPVQKGDHMVYLYSPDLLTAQEELIQALDAVENARDSQTALMQDITRSTLASARDKLRLWGLTAQQITEIETSRKAQDHITIYAPIGGIVIHKNALEGQYVQTGTRIYTIADLSEVWVYLDAYESDLEWLRYGQPVTFTTVSYPGQTFEGTIAFIDPVLNDKTRTVRVRVNVPNSEGKLKPMMFVKATVQAKVAVGGRVMDANLAGKWICPMHPDVIKPEPGTCDICGMSLVRTESLGYVGDDPSQTEAPLVIPVSAALVTGTRAVVYVQTPGVEKPTFVGRQIVLGPRADDYYLVRSGLSEGEQVVVKGNFKIDSSLQIMAKPSMMTPDVAGPESASHGGMDVPQVFQKQLQLVVAAAERIRQAAADEPIEALVAAYTQLDNAIGQVDMSLLSGQMHLEWMEYRMRLSNDAAEGKAIRTPQDARRVQESLMQNLNALKEHFALAKADTGAAHSRSVTEAFQKQLGGVLEAYYRIQQALSQDSVQAARTGVQQTLEALKSVDAALLSDQMRPKWNTTASRLTADLQDTLSAETIQAVREHFYSLSQNLVAAARLFGVAGTHSIYVLRCPMAFENTGAIWLQDNPDVRNPYFGETMPKCGSVEDMIPVLPSSEENR